MTDQSSSLENPLRRLSPLALIAGALVLLAWAVASGQPLVLGGAVGGVIGAGVLVAFSQERLLFIELVLSVLVAGTVQYFLGILIVNWLCFALAAGIFVRFVIAGTMTNAFRRPSQVLPLVFLILFEIHTLVTTLASGSSMIAILLGLKIYLPIWLIALVIAFSPITETLVEKLERGVFLAMLVQIPFVFDQHFLTSSWDSVVGTFAGEPGAGGCNATLMLLCLTSILLAIQLYQTGRMALKAAAGHVTLAFLILLAGEVKAVIFLLPLALAVQQFPLFVRNPRKFLTAVPVVLLALATIFFVYNKLYWTSSDEGRAQTMQERSIGALFDWTALDNNTGDATRFSALAIWALDRRTDWPHRLAGYGAGATRLHGSGEPGIIGARFAPIAVSSTSTSQLLWEGGLIGLALHTAIILSGSVVCAGLARRAKDDVAKGRLMTITALLSVMFVIQSYDAFETGQVVEQLLLAVLTGLVCAARRDGTFLPAADEAAEAASP